MLMTSKKQGRLVLLTLTLNKVISNRKKREKDNRLCLGWERQFAVCSENYIPVLLEVTGNVNWGNMEEYLNHSIAIISFTSILGKQMEI